MILKQSQQQTILDIMDKYRTLHEKISNLESSILELDVNLKKLYAEKDTFLKGMEDTKDEEASLMKTLIDEYGEGKINIHDLSWIENKK